MIALAAAVLPLRCCRSLAELRRTGRRSAIQLTDQVRCAGVSDAATSGLPLPSRVRGRRNDCGRTERADQRQTADQQHQMGTGAMHRSGAIRGLLNSVLDQRYSVNM